MTLRPPNVNDIRRRIAADRVRHLVTMGLYGYTGPKSQWPPPTAATFGYALLAHSGGSKSVYHLRQNHHHRVAGVTV